MQNQMYIEIKQMLLLLIELNSTKGFIYWPNCLMS